MTDETKPDPKRAAQLTMGQKPKAEPKDEKPAPKAAEPEPEAVEESNVEEA